jgi:hypothetical protein
VITRSDGLNIDKILVQDESLSDHFPVCFQLPLPKPRWERKKVTFRSYRKIDQQELKDDIRNSELITSPANTASELTEQFHDTMTELMEKHAPLITKTITVKPHTPWYNSFVNVVKN